MPTLPPGHTHLAIIEGDTWLHILIGEDLLRTRTFPTKESYSFTAAGKPSMAFEWLGQVGMALVNRAGGLRALAASVILLTALLMLLIYYYAWLSSGNSKASFVASVLMMPLISPFYTLRPQLLGYIFLAITLILLEHFRQGRRKPLWLLPALFVLWVNTHGCFVLGLVVLFVHWVSGLFAFEVGILKVERWSRAERQQLTLVSLLSVLALGVTPYGTRLASFTVRTIFHVPLGMAHIVEYQSLGAFGDLLRIFLLLLLLLILAQITLGPKYRLAEIILLATTAYGACVHVRLLAFFVLVFAPLMAKLLAGWVPAYNAAKDRYLLNAFLLALILLGVVRFFPSQQGLADIVERGFPRSAADYLRGQPAVRLFHEDLWGGYLVRRLGQQRKIFLDSRSLYEEAGVFGDYLSIISVEPDTLPLLRKYAIEACLIERDGPLATFLSALPDWQQVHADKVSALFYRKSLRPDPGPKLAGKPGAERNRARMLQAIGQ